MKLLRFLSVVCILLSALPMQAQSPEDKPKKQAKDLFDKASKETVDRAGQVRDACQAAQLQPKDRKYSEACDSYRDALLKDDRAAFGNASLAYQSHNLDKAETLARQVSTLDAKLSGQAKALLDTIKGERSSAQGVEEIKAAWERGDFNTVQTLAPTMTTQATKATADIYVKDVNLYNDYLVNASRNRPTNPQEALRIYGLAKQFNKNGPGDVDAKIAEIQNAMNAKTQPASGGKGGAGSGAGNGTPAEIADKVSKLLNVARAAEKGGNSADALKDYQAILRLQPDNSEAKSHAAKLEQAIKNDPTAAANELKSAIRDFYQGQYDTARTALMDYIESPQTAKNSGAADFYLGATLIERSILRTPQAEWKGPSVDALNALKDARKAKYNPVRAYVSPLLLKIWDNLEQ